MSVLEQFGLNPDDLDSHVAEVSYPPTVKGRVAHIDADFIAYQVSAESKDELDPDVEDVPRKSYEDMIHNATVAVEHLMKLAGAESYVCHVTPTGSTKGGRDDQAVQAEYQANRKDRTNKPEKLDDVREYIANNLNGVSHTDQEADDGLAQAAYNATDKNLVVIVSKDKDLLMVPGLHLNWDTGDIIDVDDPFGWIAIDDTKSTKKLVGRGTKFFWAQCLMGDTADHIKGVPFVRGSKYLKVQPTKAYEKALSNFDLTKYAVTDALKAQHAKHVTALQSLESKTKKCGAVLAYELLKDVDNDKDAYELVRSCWEDTGKEPEAHVFRHWKTQDIVSPRLALAGDMRLLWMRRSKNPDDVFVWLKEQLAR